MYRLISLALMLALFACACGGACQEARDRFDVEWRHLAARSGTGLATSSAGEYHVGMTLSPGVLQQVLTQSSDVIPSFSEALTSEDPETGRRSRFQVHVDTRLVEIELLEEQGNAVRLALECNIQVAIRQRGGTREHHVRGSMPLEGRLEIHSEVGTTPSLDVQLNSLDVEGLSLGIQPLPPHIGEALVEFVGAELAERLGEIEQISLLRFPHFHSGAVSVALRPAGLATFPDRGLLFVGLLTNLRPLGTAYLEPDLGVQAEGIVVSIHPGLAAAAVRLGQAEGTIPATLTPDEEDPHTRALVDDIVLSDLGFEIRFRAWDFRAGYCLDHPLGIGGEVRLREGSVELLATSAGNGAYVSEDETVDPSHWLRSSFTRQIVSLTEILVDWSTLTLGNGELLELIPTAFATNEWQIRVVLRMD